jgi:hypothetical protein
MRMSQNLVRNALALMPLAAGCSETAGTVHPPAANTEITVSGDERENGSRPRQLPGAHGRTFATLDEYLAHLRDYAGPVGQPWYRKIGEDRYELVSNLRPAGAPQIFTRAQLMERFGFTR